MRSIALRTADISGKIDKSIVTGLLSKLARFDAQFLDKIAREDITDADCQMPADNQVAVAVAIALFLNGDRAVD